MAGGSTADSPINLDDDFLDLEIVPMTQAVPSLQPSGPASSPNISTGSSKPNSTKKSFQDFKSAFPPNTTDDQIIAIIPKDPLKEGLRPRDFLMNQWKAYCIRAVGGEEQSPAFLPCWKRDRNCLKGPKKIDRQDFGNIAGLWIRSGSCAACLYNGQKERCESGPDRPRNKRTRLPSDRPRKRPRVSPSGTTDSVAAQPSKEVIDLNVSEDVQISQPRDRPLTTGLVTNIVPRAEVEPTPSLTLDLLGPRRLRLPLKLIFYGERWSYMSRESSPMKVKIGFLWRGRFWEVGDIIPDVSELELQEYQRQLTAREARIDAAPRFGTSPGPHILG